MGTQVWQVQVRELQGIERQWKCHYPLSTAANYRLRGISKPVVNNAYALRSDYDDALAFSGSASSEIQRLTPARRPSAL